ncbi:hypothetical protein GGI25_005358 [Coemansia spiralis]|uniref:Tyrosinase copper-binding domain-containing protein n=2 Tax=Coemansia TaxID=4863 RepID=A0A9W8G3D3_9FUNG|nr:hypothetical protein BX070DRAFT_230995 [Coemansia spiralis]KAJ1988358.1 hypothetical protein EDC05_005332 [Coemansia umbellata]KAJ2619684.1 hypothetical protein GGI26_005636 [Coemansia sp. RSA 1358]KAJ2671807.1 hypothetical protein GGI25_005358 [Coemansia spiralis]
MKIYLIVGFVFAHIASQLVSAQGGCPSIVTRRDIATLSPQEWSQMAGVINRMYADGWFQYFAEVHNREFGNIHGNDNFFPWHRRFLREFEEIGQRYDRNFAVPYWDELRDARDPAGSPVLTSGLLGGNGFGGCVRDGFQAGWMLTFPNSHCLTRQYDRGNQMQSWYSPEYIYSIMQRYGDMHGLRENIEYTIHGSVHLSVGGDMATYWSPNDFIFFLHHANLDRLWDQWQSWGHGSTMDGRNQNGSPMSLGAPLPHYGEPVGSTVQLGVGRMCFRYAGGRGGGRAAKGLSLASKPHRGSVESANGGLSRLPKHLLDKWFPVLAREIGTGMQPENGTATPARNSTRGTMIPGTRPSKKPLPYPAPLTNSWISMHKFDREKVAKIMAEARQFVDDMNNANYNSPY